MEYKYQATLIVNLINIICVCIYIELYDITVML